jgi:hypothetical protein
MEDFARKFGVEIELWVGRIDETNWMSISKQQPKTITITHWAGSQFAYTPSKVKDFYHVRLHDGWVFHLDASCNFEVVSPPIQSMDSVRKQVEAIVASRMPIAFKNTGLHIHVDAGDYGFDELLNIGRFCRSFDRAIFSFMNPGRTNGRFCRFMAMNDERIRQSAKIVVQAMRGSAENIGRYKGLNLDAFAKHRTVEFRYSEGTLDLLKIESLTRLYIGIVNWCKANRFGSLEMPKKLADKRRFLLDLVGVDGDYRAKLLEATNIHPVTAEKVLVKAEEY